MRKSRILNIDLEYKKENPNIIFNYESRPFDDNKVYKSHCSCGFKDDRNHSVCPVCKTTDCKSIHYAGRRENEYVVTAYNFDKLSATIELKKYECCYNSEENTFDLTADDVKIIFKYELNSRNRYKYSAQHVINGQSERLLKATLDEYGFGVTETKVKDAFVGLCGISCNYYDCFNETVWSINNKYKHCFDALQKEIYEGYEYDLTTLKAWSSLINRLDEKGLKYLIKYAQLDNRRNNSINGYHIRNLFNSYNDNINSLYEYVDIYESIIDRREIQQNNFPHNWRNAESLAKFFQSTGFTLEELIELIELSERQAFRIDVNSHKVRTIYTALSNIGMPIDKKPREMAIYINKMDKLLNIENSWKACEIKGLDLDLYGMNNNIIIKKVFDKYGYKGLDHMLFNYYMNKETSPLYLYATVSNGQKYLDCVAFLNTKNNVTEITVDNIDTLLTAENELLTEKEEIVNYLNTKTNENIDNEKEIELVC